MGQPVQLKDATLEDKYTQASGRVYLTGMQALVRLPLLQAALDRHAGLNTAGFVTGYRGSPLGGYDAALKKAAGHLSANNVRFQPGINEDLAATTIWGTQQVSTLSEKQVDGVFGIWYGKGPGVDRSVDVLKHANAAGTSKFGGVVAIMGDDHGCQSSTLPHQSEQVMMAAMIPVLNPSDLQENIDYGLLGFALSRYSGCWVGLKATTEIIETSATVDVSPDRIIVQEPADFKLPEDGVSIRWPDPPLDQERRLHGPKMDAVLAFARANAIDRRVLGDATAKLGIVASGKAYGDVVEALHALGIGEEEAEQLGISVYKVGMSWPLEPEGIADFASQLDELLVVEEKRGFLEDQIARILYNLAERPVLSSKLASGDAVALPSFGELTPGLVADVIVKRLEPHSGPMPELENRARQMNAMAEAVRLDGQSARTPFFCSGCPHNTSTNVPEGSRAMAGIGCHGMAYSIPERRTSLITQMGGEGATWIGQAPYTSEGHVFQNMGDGTYMHSGLLAIRAAVAAGVNITYKILFNDAVAMTGGQEHDGELTVPLITRQVAAEGAKKIYVVSDEPEKYESRAGLASGVKVHHRDDLTAIQKELRDTPGVTILVYDQTCAAEKRRRRKRGTFADPDQRVFINHRVCEGCGDCSVKSNCISVRPKETEYGRKREIDQSSCNKDYSCLNGFCPSFVTVQGARLKKRARTQTSEWQNDLPRPQVPSPDHAYNILITGIGGTGVVTIGALLGMAAHLENKGVTVLDETGLAQKNGGVTSHVRIAPTQDELTAARIGAGSADLLLACDLVVAASPACNSRLDAKRTRALINETVTPTAAFVRDGTINLSAAADRKVLSQRLGQSAEFVRASELAVALMGDSIATNLFMLGYAWQKGYVPLSFKAIDRAIMLNAVATEANRQAFHWGRSAAHDLQAVNELALDKTADSVEAPFNVDDFISRRVEDLTAYQDEAYAKRYADMLQKVKAAEMRLMPGQTRLTEAVARNYYKLMAYKDEYEVARFYTDGKFLSDLKAQFDGDLRVSYHLAPPVFSRRDRDTGELKKRKFGPWVRVAFQLLARLKGLRGGPFDIFGWTAERRMERRLIAEYEAMLEELLDNLTPAHLDTAIEIAAAPRLVKGYGHIKERNAEVYREEVARLLGVFRNPENRKRLAI